MPLSLLLIVPQKVVLAPLPPTVSVTAEPLAVTRFKVSSQGRIEVEIHALEKVHGGRSGDARVPKVSQPSMPPVKSSCS